MSPMGFWITALGAAVGVLASSFIKTWFDHFVSGASLKAAQQDDDLKIIMESTEDVRDLAIAYWQCGASNLQDSREAAAISGRLMFTGKVADELFKGDLILQKEVQIELNRFDESITRGSFMGKDREADLGRLPEIEDCAYKLI